MTTLFINGKISSGRGNETILTSFRIDGSNFSAISNDLKPFDGEPVINLKGMLVLPGGIDPHVHFNTPGFEERETFETGSAFAASGGITTVIDMPCTSLPPVTNVVNLENKLAAISGRSYIDYALWGGVSGNCFQGPDWAENMEALWKAGVVGFKTYSLSGMPTFTHLTPAELGEVMKFAGRFGILIGHHAEAAEIVLPITQKLMSEGRVDAAAYALSREKRGIWPNCAP